MIKLLVIDVTKTKTTIILNTAYITCDHIDVTKTITVIILLNEYINSDHITVTNHTYLMIKLFMITVESVCYLVSIDPR